MKLRNSKSLGRRFVSARSAIVICLASCLALVGIRAIAASPAEDAPTLHVLRPIIHAEKAKAELCLEFDHPIVAQNNAERPPASLSLKLESEDRKQTLTSRAATYSGNELCIPSLSHRTTYKLKLNAFHSSSNGKLGSPYSLSFTVPARRSMLAFVGDDTGSTVARWHENPVLRSINVAKAKLELFRIKDPARMAEAWSLRAQTSLAPSETATFAHANGELIWQGSLVFEGKPDEGNEKQVPLPENAEAGLYLAVASAPNLVTKKTELVPISAMWLLRSDLKIKLLQTDNGFHALAYDERAAQTPIQVNVTAYNRDFKKLAESQAETDGVAWIQKPTSRGSERKDEPLVGVVMATDSRNHVAFADLDNSTAKSSIYTLPPSETALLVARAAYAPGATAEAQFAAQDQRGRGLAIKGSTLRIFRNDGGLYASYPVQETVNGKARLAFPTPITEGIWPLIWQQSDGTELARATLKVASVVNAPQLEVSADRKRLMPDGEIILTVRSQISPQSSAPYTAGKIRIEWKKSENIYSGWSGYAFGVGTREERREGKFLIPNGTAQKSVSFVTDENGAARIPVRLASPARSGETDSTASSLWVATLAVEGECGSGAFAPPSLELPLMPSRLAIGIKPLAPQARFPENGLARFDIVALDGEGNRLDANNLVYRVYEEGRRFDWYPNEGKWDYKPIPHRTRVEGGSLAISASNRDGTRLEIPITSGIYKLEIADSEGEILAQIPFSAGWGTTGTPHADIAPLAFKLMPTSLRHGSEAKIQLKLDHPAIIRAIIADDRVRKIVQQTKHKGNAEITFSPSSDWARKIKITVEIETPGQSSVLYRGQIETTLALSATAAGIAPFTKKELEEAASQTLAAQSIKSGLTFSAAFEQSRSSGAPSRNQTSGTLMALNSSDRLTLEPKRDWSPTEQLAESKGPTAEQGVRSSSANKKRKPHKEERASGKPGGAAFIAPTPIVNLPTILSYIVDRPAYTTLELTGSVQNLRKWSPQLSASGLLAESALDNRVRAETARILERQFSDGGFAPLPGEEADIPSTTAALSALSAEQSPALAPAIALAKDWLAHRLENAWFDERERAERALAYGALARSGRNDVSNLRYFADTSANKELPPLATANIALAFAYDNDKNQALLWIDKTRSAIARERVTDAAIKPPEGLRNAGQQDNNAELVSPSSLTDTDTRPDLVEAWRTLAENHYMNSDEALSEINRMSEAIFAKSGKKHSLEIMNNLAWAMKDSLSRMEPWRIEIRGVENRVGSGVLVVPLPQLSNEAAIASRQSAVIRNISGKPLAIELAQWNRKSSVRANITRKILELDGAPTHNELRQDQTYLIVVEGQWPESDASGLLIVERPDTLLATQTCAINAIAAVGFLDWLKDWNITPVQHCERTQDGIYIRLAPPQRGLTDKPSGAWRVVWFAKTQSRGSQMLPPPLVRALLPGAKAYEGPIEKIKVN
ncbi:MAG: hypothetical protein ABTQ34_08705 [Bdellovibrionales bacterium]